ncbi:MAG: 6-carboxytetrahydropterin synthase [Bacteroidales bacterium]|nr:6-carboxytetrahydropterin synthase [Bacteroidales bacterium]
MYYIKKTIEISGAHRLELDYPSKCSQLHGHNWTITVYCKSRELDKNGMIIDFCEIKHRISDVLDHKVLNDVLPFNPTAENLAHWCQEQIPYCYKVDVLESGGNEVTYEVDTL